MSKLRRLPILITGLLVIGVLTVSAVTVEEVHVENRGAGPLEKSSVLAYTSLNVGDEFSRGHVSQDVKNLQKSGRFSFVEALVDRVPGGVAITYVVEAKPRIRRLKIEGADALSNKKVSKLLELGVGDLVDDATLAVRAQKVKEAYHKKYYPYTKMDWTIDTDRATGMADVEVVVKEGPRAKIRRIVFEGNAAFSSRTLRGSIRQRQLGLFSWLTGSGAYKPDELVNDVTMIRELYLNRGYLDVEVKEPIVRQAKRQRIDIIIPIEEGTAYRIGDVKVEGISLFEPADVERAVMLDRGHMASRRGIDQTAQSLRDYYGSRGYIETSVREELDADPDTGVVDLTFGIKEGNLAYIRDVGIRGNTRTQDKVIRRELAMAPGDVFNEVRIRTSERRLWNLGYFSFVDSVRDTTLEPDYYDVTFEVEEQKTGQFVIGAGFSSVDDIIGFVELSQGNFDLFGWPHFTGAGQKLKLRTQFGTERTDYEISFVEPWLFNRKLSLGLDFFQHDRQFLSDDYDQKNLGGSISLGKALWRHTRGKLRYSLEDIDVYNVSETASDLIKDEEGRRTKSAMTLSITRDTRDSVFVATRGNRASISGTLAGGPLGADTDIYRLEAESSQYIPLWFGHVLNLKARVAFVDNYGDSETVPIFERLFLGGARNVRGFRYRDVGPKVGNSENYEPTIDEETGEEVATTDLDEPIGGKSLAYATAEYNIPLGKSFRFAAFYDAGMVWEREYNLDGDLNSAWGIGLRFDIPGFPLRLDYAWPIKTDEYNDQPSGRFSFLIGYVF